MYWYIVIESLKEQMSCIEKHFLINTNSIRKDLLNLLSAFLFMLNENLNFLHALMFQREKLDVKL